MVALPPFELNRTRTSRTDVLLLDALRTQTLLEACDVLKPKKIVLRDLA